MKKPKKVKKAKAKELCSVCGKGFRGWDPLTDGKGNLFHKKCAPKPDWVAMRQGVGEFLNNHGVYVEPRPTVIPDQRVLHTPVAYAAAVRGDLDNTLVAQMPGGIERQEAKGQQDSNAQRTLPIKMDWDALEKLGFIRGEGADNLFLKVEFPLNWNKLGTNHHLWSYLIDDRGRIRGDIFYKAAFYDRAAHGSLRRRYSIRPEYGKNRRREVMVVEDQAFLYEAAKGETPTVIHRMKIMGEGFEAEDKADAEIRAWMKEHYPEWEDPVAYWS